MKSQISENTIINEEEIQELQNECYTWIAGRQAKKLLGEDGYYHIGKRICKDDKDKPTFEDDQLNVRKKDKEEKKDKKKSHGKKKDNGRGKKKDKDQVKKKDNGHGKKKGKKASAEYKVPKFKMPKCKKIKKPDISLSEVLKEHEIRTPNVIAGHLKFKTKAISIDDKIHFYDKARGFYEPQSESSINKATMALLDEDEKLSISYSEIKEAFNLLLCDGRLNRDFDQFSHPHLVNCLNGVVDVKNNKLLEHSPDYCFTYCINAEFEETPEDKYFSNFIDEATLGDSQLKKLLSEWTGYLLSDISFAKKAGIMLGGSNSGKSLYNFLIKNLLCGELQTSAVDFHHFDNQVSLAKLMSKKVNISNEISSAPIKDFSKFKQLTSDLDTINSRELYKNPKEQKCTTKLHFATNLLPILAPNEGEDLNAFFNRILIIPFENTVADENIDETLKFKLLNDKNAMFMFAMKGLRRYLNNNHNFTYCERSATLLSNYRLKYSPYQEFIKINMEKEDGAECFWEDVKEAYKNFCKAHNIDSNLKCAKLLKAELLKDGTITFSKLHRGKKNQYGYKGIKLVIN